MSNKTKIIKNPVTPVPLTYLKYNIVCISCRSCDFNNRPTTSSNRSSTGHRYTGERVGIILCLKRK